MGKKKKNFKISIIGDGAVGKTSMILSFLKKDMSGYMPTVADFEPTDIQIDDQTVTINLADTAGQSEYDRLRPLMIRDSDVIIIAFRVNSLSSFNNVASKWIHEAKHYVPDAPVVLVTTAIDLRDSGQNIDQKKKDQFITYEQGKQQAKAIQAARYLECSSLTQKGLESVFQQATRLALDCSLKKRIKQNNNDNHNNNNNNKDDNRKNAADDSHPQKRNSTCEIY